MDSLSRRAFLTAAVMFAPAMRLRAIAQPTRTSAVVSVDAFVRLSERLVGRTTLDPQVAATYLNRARR